MTNASVFNERAPKLINRLRGLAATELRGLDIVMQGVTWYHLLNTDRTAGTQYLNHDFISIQSVREGHTIITEIKHLDKFENSLLLKGANK